MESLNQGSKAFTPIQLRNQDKTQQINSQDDDIFEGIFPLSIF